MKLLISLIVLFSMSLHAFETSNLQLLYSDKFDGDAFIYDTQDAKKTTLTFEHFRTHSYGDLFMFVDAVDAKALDGTSFGVYTEIGPRLSLSKVLGRDLSNSFIQDIFIATQINIGKDYRAYLYGLGANFKVPGFNLFSVNLYNKNENINTDNTYQITSAYATKSFYNIHLEGFIDITKRDVSTQNQLLLNVGSAFDTKENIYVGTEWLYYRYDYDGSTSGTNVFQVMIKYVF